MRAINNRECTKPQRRTQFASIIAVCASSLYGHNWGRLWEPRQYFENAGATLGKLGVMFRSITFIQW